MQLIDKDRLGCESMFLQKYIAREGRDLERDGGGGGGGVRTASRSVYVADLVTYTAG